MSAKHYGLCNFCDAACGLEIEYEGKNIIAVRGDKDHGFSRGHVCPKGLAQRELYHDPDRLKRPLRRRGDKWEEVSWEEALDEAGRGLARARKQHGPDAVGVYWGNPAAHDYGSLLSVLPFSAGFRTKNVYCANSVDSLTRMLVSFLGYGSQAVMPIPDLDRLKHFLIIGANPAISHGSVMSAPDTRKRLCAVRERGGKIIVIDPRRSETAALADRHIFIRPGSDAIFLFAMLSVIFSEKLDRPRDLAGRIDRIEELKRAAQGFAPEKAEGPTGIPASEIRGLAREFAAAESAVCYGRMGVSTQEFGALATWLIDALNIVTGNMGRVGGYMFDSPAVDLAWLARVTRQFGSFDSYRSRVSGLPEFGGYLPVAALHEEIETPGPGQIKAMVTLAGNPVLSLPNTNRLDRALAGLDFMVSIDFYMNETTRHADIILPPVSTFETGHYPILEYALGVRNYAQYVHALFPRGPEDREGWEVMVDLVHSFEKNLGGLPGAMSGIKRGALRTFSPRRQLSLLLRLGPRKIKLSELEKLPHGLDLGPLEPGVDHALGKKGRINLLPDQLAADLPRLSAKLEAAADDGTLLLISRRTMRGMNTWLHNLPSLVKGKHDCTLQINPADAARRELADGESAAVSSRVGEIMVQVEVTDEMMPGVVSMNFGWGHNRDGARLSVASERPGAGMNDVVDEKLFDKVSGISVLDGLPVRVTGVSHSPSRKPPR